MNLERTVEKRGLSKETTKSDDRQRMIYNVGVRNEVIRRLRKIIKMNKTIELQTRLSPLGRAKYNHLEAY